MKAVEGLNSKFAGTLDGAVLQLPAVTAARTATGKRGRPVDEGAADEAEEDETASGGSEDEGVAA